MIRIIVAWRKPILIVINSASTHDNTKRWLYPASPRRMAESESFMTKILICGAAGQLGTDCRRVFQEDHDILAVDIDELDITRPEVVNRVVGDYAPDVMINCAAYTQVDACETDKDRAHSINGEGPGILAGAMAAAGGLMVHISTDYVFDGKRPPPTPYTESDTPCPESAYGATKLEGEAAVRAAGGRHIIVRTAWLYGAVGGNFLKTILKRARKNPDQTLRVVDDQFGSPTWSLRLAGQIRKLIGSGGQGIYHASAHGYCTWYELADYFLKQMKVTHPVVPCTTAAYPTPATRPKNAILENRRLMRHGLDIMEDWRTDLDRFISESGAALLEETETKAA